jgi:flagellar hook-basal body complex protein FliE
MIDSISSLNSTAMAGALRNMTSSNAATQADAANPDPGVVATNFSDFMGSLGKNFVNNIEGAEKASMDGIMGKTSAREVVDKVMTADQTLQTAMAFRDKIVSAYLELVKMPI